MVMSFFRKGDGGLDTIAAHTVSMLAEARHSFDLSSMALLSGADVNAVADDVRATDDRINQAEQDLRGELVVHVSVHGSDDIGEVLGYTLLIKKIERIGDQAKNILDLAEEGAQVGEGVVAPVLEEPGTLGRDVPLRGIRNVSLLVDQLAEVVDLSGGVVALVRGEQVAPGVVVVSLVAVVIG